MLRTSTDLSFMTSVSKTLIAVVKKSPYGKMANAEDLIGELTDTARMLLAKENPGRCGFEVQNYPPLELRLLL